MSPAANDGQTQVELDEEGMQEFVLKPLLRVIAMSSGAASQLELLRGCEIDREVMIAAFDMIQEGAQLVHDHLKGREVP